MVEKVIWIKSGTTISVGVSVKILNNIICAKEIIFWILLHVVVEMVKIYEVLLTLLVITCDEIIETTKSTSTRSASTKTFTEKTTSTNLYILQTF